ncbi:MAG: hypothetical protein QW734_03670 [Candidatus Bathyarchaeia archaeon]
MNTKYYRSSLTLRYRYSFFSEVVNYAKIYISIDSNVKVSKEDLENISKEILRKLNLLDKLENAIIDKGLVCDKVYNVEDISKSDIRYLNKYRYDIEFGKKSYRSIF